MDEPANEDEDQELSWLDPGGAEALSATVDVLVVPELAVTAHIDPRCVTQTRRPKPAVAAASAEASAEEPALPQLGRYGVLGKLGEGGMGVVFCARDPNLRRQVAVKHGGNFQDDPDGKQRFVLEAQITAQLDHPGIVPVYSLEAGNDGGVAYAMKVVRGVELADRIAEARALLEAQGPESVELRELQRELIEKLVRVCETLEFVHAQGALHRDLKPENIMLGAHQEVYVMDWGLAKMLGHEEVVDSGQTLESLSESALPDTQTVVGSIKGTPLYMAPEQARAELDRLGPATDIYALGMILYEILYLQRARVGTNLISVIDEAMNNVRAPAPPGLDRQPELAAIVAKAAAAEPEERYASALALGEDLTRVLRGEETTALPDAGWRKLRRWVRHHPHRALGLLAVTALAAVLLVAGTVTWQRVASSRAEVREAERARTVQVVRSRAELGRDRIARHFLYYGSLSASLTASTARVLEHAQPGPARVFAPSAFAQLEGAPPGTAKASGYGGRLISPRAFVGRGAPGADAARVEREHRLLSHLLDPCRETLMAGVPGSLSRWKTRPPAGVDQAILTHAIPLEWVYVALESTGAIALFPGANNAWPADYDARKRSWYAEAKQAYASTGQRRNWSQPYVDLMGQGVVVTCTEVCLASDGTMLGVVALDLSFDDAARRYLSWSDLAGFERATIVRKDGHIFMRLRDGGKPKLYANGTVDLGRYGDTEALAAISAGGTDHLVRGQRLTLWVEAPLLDWVLIVDVDLPQLEGKSS